MISYILLILTSLGIYLYENRKLSFFEIQLTTQGYQLIKIYKLYS